MTKVKALACHSLCKTDLKTIGAKPDFTDFGVIAIGRRINMSDLESRRDVDSIAKDQGMLLWQ